MGSAASTPEAEAQLKKWEAAVNDLSQLCQDQRKALSLPARLRPVPQSQTDDKDGELRQSFRNRRTSSLVSFEHGKQGAGQPDGAASDPMPIPKSPKLDATRRSTHMEFSNTERTSPSGGKERNLARDQIMQIKKARSDLFSSYEPPNGERLDEIEGAYGCAHYAVIAAGLSALLGGARNETDRKKRVTVEDLFFAVQIPLSSLHSDVAHLTEIYDVVRDFIDVDNRFKDRYVAECVHLDIAPVVGQVEMEGNEVGDRQPRVSLPEFRKHVQTDLEEDASSIRFLYYDPYILQQTMSTDEDGEEKSESDADGLAFSITRRDPTQKKVGKVNHGHLSCVVDFRNSVQPMIMVADAAASGRLFVHQHEVSLAAVYKAMKAPQITGRAGGYIRVSLRRSAETHKDEVPTFFSPELCSGKVVGTKADGNDAHSTHELISRHITASAWAFHFLAGSHSKNHNHGQGLPISSIIRELKLPIDAFVRSSLGLDQVYLYIQQYLHLTRLEDDYRVSLFPVITKTSRAEAAPTLSVFDLEAVLIDVKSANTDPEAPSHMMILQYDANIAHNVLNLAHKPQWCVLVGYDEDVQMARCVDANPVRFSASWTISLERLHKAITNYGYIILSKLRVARPMQPQSLGASVSSRDGSPRHSSTGTPPGPALEAGEEVALRHISSTLKARYELLQEQPSPFPMEEVFPHFVYPVEPLTVTQIAAALTRIGVLTTVDELIHKIPFDINALLGQNLSLHSMALIARTYVEQLAADGVFITTEVHHADRFGIADKSLDLAAFTFLLQRGLAKADSTVLVNFDQEYVSVFGPQHPCGEYGLVMRYDPQSNLVTVADVNPNKFFRVWRTPAKSLFDAMYRSSGPFRSRGLIIIARAATPPLPPAGLSRRCDLSIVPLQNVFALSPSPQIQGLSMAFAQLGYFFSAEEIFYEAYLKTMTDQRRRGSQAFAWRDVEVTLSMVSKSNADVTAKVARKFLESRKVNELGADVVEDVEEEDLEKLFADPTVFGPDATAVLLANYRTEVAHKVTHFGPSMALIRSYDPTTKTVGLFEAEHTRFGLFWTITLEGFIKACDLRNEGKSDYGLVKLHIQEAQPRRVGMGFNKSGFASDDAQESSMLSDSREGRRAERAQSPRTVFLLSE